MLSGAQLNAASAAMQAVTLSGDIWDQTSFSDLNDEYQRITASNGDNASPADLQGFLSAAKNYATTDAWESLSVPAYIATAGAADSYSPSTLKIAAADAPGTVGDWITAPLGNKARMIWESTTKTAASAWEGVKSVAKSIGAVGGSVFGSLWDTAKWVLYIVAGVFGIWLIIQAAPLFRRRDGK